MGSFLLYFLNVVAILLRIFHYNFAPVEGRRGARLGARSSLNNYNKIFLAIYEGSFCCFLLHVFFWGAFVFMERGGGLCMLAFPPTKTYAFIFVNKMLALKFILCRILIVAVKIRRCTLIMLSTRVTLFLFCSIRTLDSNVIVTGFFISGKIV